MECDPRYDWWCEPDRSFWYQMWHWVSDDLVLSIIVNALLFVLALLLLWIAWAIVDHFRTPFCRRCNNNRTKASDELGQPLCYPCRRELEAEAEGKVKCLLHKVEMEKRIIEDYIIIDVCPVEGCVFLGPDEMRSLRHYHESEADDSHMMGLLTGVVIGTAID